MGKLVMFFAVAYFLASRFLKLITKSALEKRPRQMLIGYLLLIASLYAWAAAHFGSFAAVYVASLGGALLGMSNFDLKEKVKKGMESVLVSLPVGVFFVVFGMEMNLKEAEGYLPFLTVLFVTVIGIKLVGYWIATRTASEPLGNWFLVMIGTLPQGEIGILIAAYLFSRGVVNPSQFSITAIVVVILAMITPILMKVAPVQWRKRETIVASPIEKDK
jgi:Kef-type K+ transport system membrane component KefB